MAVCPSTPSYPRQDGDPNLSVGSYTSAGTGATAAASGFNYWNPICGVTDYAGFYGVSQSFILGNSITVTNPLGMIADPTIVVPSGNVSNANLLAAVNATVNISAVTDGTSNTIYLIESAGRPYLYNTGNTLQAGNAAAVQAGGGINGGGWARPASDIWLIGSANQAGTTIPTAAVTGGTININANNGWAANSNGNTSTNYYPILYGNLTNVFTAGTGAGDTGSNTNYLNSFGNGAPYSFHPGGVNTSVRRWVCSLPHYRTTSANLAALVTRNGGEESSISQ